VPGPAGRFLEMTAKRLGVEITELGPLAMKGFGDRVPMNSYCIVFGTQSLVNALAAGSTREDVAAAACHSVAEQVFEQQLQEVDIKEPVIMVGGTSLIEGLVTRWANCSRQRLSCRPTHSISVLSARRSLHQDS
jgi:activator of 2-hydroxyglutaryl-CoA dehydratase